MHSSVAQAAVQATDWTDEARRRLAGALGHATDGVAARWRRRAVGPASSDAMGADVLVRHRDALVDATIAALWPAATAGAWVTGGDAADPRVSPLVDDDDVALDIASARLSEVLDERLGGAAERLRACGAEWLRPRRLVEALTLALAALPLERAAAATFLCDVAADLAMVMRAVQAAAPPSPDAQRPVAPAREPLHRAEREAVRLLRLRDALGEDPLPAMGLTSLRRPGPTSSTAQRSAAGHPSSLVGLDAFDALDAFHDEILRDEQLGDEVRELIERLRPALRRQVGRDASVAGDDAHPMWRFVDTLAHRQAHAAAPDRLRLLGLGRNLVDVLARDPGAGVEPPFSWALHRLGVGADQLLAATVASNRASIAALDRLLAEAAALDTTPAALYSDPDPAAMASSLDPQGGAWPGAASAHAVARVRGAVLRTGAVWRMRLRGRWQALQALRSHGPDGVWLLREVPSARLWALRPAAVDALVYAGLAHPLRQRSLLRRARWRIAHADA